MMMGWIADNYGSRSGMVRDLAFRASWRVHPGIPDHVELAGIDRLVFVCKGNICRSALAKSVADSLGFPACSFGFRTTPGKPADSRMSQASAALGYDLSGHRTRCVSEYVASPGDLVLFFQPEHMWQLAAALQPASGPALLGLWSRPRRPYIHDPFGSSPAYYAKASAVIRQAVLNLVAEIRKDHGP